MEFIDYALFAGYMVVILGVGYYFFRQNKNLEDYYVGSRSISPTHVGISIVATDVGGGFSIGLGGLGFAMGLSGSWLLFTGLIGAWLSAVFIIPIIKKVDQKHSMLTYPDFLVLKYDRRVAYIAALISGIGYLGFTGAQVLAGAKLAAATLFQTAPFGMDPLNFAMIAIGVVIIFYTVLGGLKAVIFTDSIQWVVLLIGLIGFAIPFTLVRMGGGGFSLATFQNGFGFLKETLPASYFSLTAIQPTMFINWMVTIIPIWLVGMTLYQRMYACKDEKDAKKAWFIAGLFEYPIMAFVGVFLGMCARALFPEVEAEQGLPLLIAKVLPTGVAGIVVAAYFSAIMSTADSCLMASSGNFLNDIFQIHSSEKLSRKKQMAVSQIVTLVIGLSAMLIAAVFQTVLDAILYAYAFMVSGLFIPTLGAYFIKKPNSNAALASMLTGGTFTLLALVLNFTMPLGLKPAFYGIILSAIVYFVGTAIARKKNQLK